MTRSRQAKTLCLSSLASADRRAEDVRILAVIIAELKFRNIQRHIFGADFVEATNNPAFEDRPKTLNRVGMDRADYVLLAVVIDRLVIVFGQAFIDPAFVSREQANFVGNHFAHESLASRAGNVSDHSRDHVALALHGTDDCRFGGRTMLAQTALAIPMLVLVLSADERPASPVRIFPTQASAPDLPASVLDSGGRWLEPFAWFDRSTRSWRTWQRCLYEGWTRFSGTWPKAGTTRNGIAFQRASISDTVESVSGLWPTLAARDYRSGALPTRSALMRRLSSRGNDLPAFLRMLIPDKSGLIDPCWAEEYMGFPSGWTAFEPSAMPSFRKSRKSSGGRS